MPVTIYTIIFLFGAAKLRINIYLEGKMWEAPPLPSPEREGDGGEIILSLYYFADRQLGGADFYCVTINDDDFSFDWIVKNRAFGQ